MFPDRCPPVIAQQHKNQRSRGGSARVGDLAHRGRAAAREQGTAVGEGKANTRSGKQVEALETRLPGTARAAVIPTRTTWPPSRSTWLPQGHGQARLAGLAVEKRSRLAANAFGAFQVETRPVAVKRLRGTVRVKPNTIRAGQEGQITGPAAARAKSARGGWEKQQQASRCRWFPSGAVDFWPQGSRAPGAVRVVIPRSQGPSGRRLRERHAGVNGPGQVVVSGPLPRRPFTCSTSSPGPARRGACPGPRLDRIRGLVGPFTAAGRCRGT